MTDQADQADQTDKANQSDPASPQTRSAVVITCSTRAAAGFYPDRSGPIVVDALRGWGFAVDEAVVVADGPDVEVALRAAIATGAALVLTTGGTGLSPSDGTPEATQRVVDRMAPGIAEAIRSAGVQAGIPSAMLSRGVSGLAGATLVVNLPGSMGGVTDGLAVLEPVVVHALSQIQGGDH